MSRLPLVPEWFGFHDLLVVLMLWIPVSLAAALAFVLLCVEWDDDDEEYL